MGPEGATALATQGLPHVTQLTSLNLYNNRIGPEGATALATQGLPHVILLTSLDLGYNGIGPEGSTALATQGLPHVTQLTSLNLRSNGIGPEGEKDFARVLFQNPSASLTDLRGIWLPDHLGAMELPSEFPNQGNADILNYLRIVKKDPLRRARRAWCIVHRFVRVSGPDREKYCKDEAREGLSVVCKIPRSRFCSATARRARQWGLLHSASRSTRGRHTIPPEKHQGQESEQTSLQEGGQPLENLGEVSL
eukprot:scaffold216_cov203-Pinguiococcus_pyrenoidosus.AAC.1